jgi:hypothetical protein
MGIACGATSRRFRIGGNQEGTGGIRVVALSSEPGVTWARPAAPCRARLMFYVFMFYAWGMFKTDPTSPPGLRIDPINKHGILAVHCDDGAGGSDMHPFNIASKAEFVRLYNASLKNVHFDFAPATHAGQTLAFTKDEQERLRIKVCLHWMCFYNMNKLPVRISKRDLDHPQTRQIVHGLAGKKFGFDSDQATALAAKACGHSTEYFKAWLERDKQLGDAF